MYAKNSRYLEEVTATGEGRLVIPSKDLLHPTQPRIIVSYGA